jgi:hypothetical protein
VKQPSCEDLRVGQTLGGLRVHSQLNQGPYFRVYGAEGEGGDWLVYGWEGPPPPDEAALARFRERAEALAALANPGIVPTRGPFFFEDGGPAWATRPPVGPSLGELLGGRVKASQAAPALSQAARALASATRAGVMHPELRAEHIQVSAEGARVGGFFSWRQLSPALASVLGAEPPNPHRPPEGFGTEAALSFAIASLAQSAGLSHSVLDAARQSNTSARPGLMALAESLDQLRPGFFGRLLGK